MSSAMANLYHFRTHMRTGTSLKSLGVKPYQEARQFPFRSKSGCGWLSNYLSLIPCKLPRRREARLVGQWSSCPPAKRVLTVLGPVDQVHFLAGSVPRKVLILWRPSLFWVCDRLMFGSRVFSPTPRSHPVPISGTLPVFLKPCVQGQKGFPQMSYYGLVPPPKSLWQQRRDKAKSESPLPNLTSLGYS